MSPPVTNRNDTERLKFKQAVLVALITGITSIIGTLLVSNPNLVGSLISGEKAKDVIINEGKTGEVSKNQNYIIIKNAEIDDGDSSSRIRVVAVVNGRAYSTPSRAFWTVPGSKMKPEAFSVESKDEYTIQFQIFSLDKENNSKLFISDEIITLKASQLPYDKGIYELHEAVDLGSGIGPVQARVRFSLTDNPN